VSAANIGWRGGWRSRAEGVEVDRRSRPARASYIVDTLPSCWRATAEAGVTW
jgi:hypothetical protein